MTLSKNQIWALILTGLFILINGLFIYNENFLASTLPLGILVVALAFLALDKLILALVFLVPLSVPLSEFVDGLEIGMNLPTEPILFGVMLVFIYKLAHERNFDKRIAYHPVSLAIYLNLLWLLITTISSTMPMVSIKFFVARLWFLIAFYFIATQIFANEKNIRKYIWLYIIAFLIVIFYSITRLSMHGLFNQKVAHWVSSPFYKDHTSYGAILAMFIPILIGFGFSQKYSLNRKLIIWSILGLFLFATILSYTRAAWVSLLGAFAVWAVIKLKIKFKYLVITGILIIGLLFAFQTQIFLQMDQNRQDSSKDMKDHVKSISNVSSDASNLERINRWACAMRMFKEKPILGWGPGTYMFKYAPFQMSYQKTIISTNAANMGNAHSEYIGPLAESGVLGMITILLIIGLTIYTAIVLYFKLRNRELKILVLSSLMGLITYYLHGFLNNFLDTDKASAPFWGFTALIVAIDVYHKNKEEENNEDLLEVDCH